MSFDPHFAADDSTSLPIHAFDKAGCARWLAEQPEARQAWARQAGFTGEAGSLLLLPDAALQLDSVLFGWDRTDFWSWAQLPAKLPHGNFHLASPLPAPLADQAALGWGLANYAFTRFKSTGRNGQGKPRLKFPDQADRAQTLALLHAIALARDLINMPANELGPAELAAAVAGVAEQQGASLQIIVGEDLLKQNYPAIYEVGRAAIPARAPRLIDLRWGEPDHPKLTLVGKGVCFDSGGLDLKSASNMKLMKKDMGGGAIMLGLASAIMAAKLPVRLRLLIPAVENAVSGDSFRPMDVIRTRKGLSVEIGNTDAEGRLILCDALTEAASEKPDLLLDAATLTGAARVALGPDLPALFTANDALAGLLLATGEREADPLWRLPLWAPYRRLLDSKIADINNASDNPHAGAITAALFLQEFVPNGTVWAHLDVVAWNSAARPGRPEGGEAMGLRALYFAVIQRFAS